jgi:hypothetical protein
MILAIERTEFGALNADFRSFARGDLESVVPPFPVLAFLVPDRSEAGTICRAQYRTHYAMSGFAALAGEISMFPLASPAFELEHRYRPAAFADITHGFSVAEPTERRSAWLETSVGVTLRPLLAGNKRHYPR